MYDDVFDNATSLKAGQTTFSATRITFGRILRATVVVAVEDAIPVAGSRRNC